ncbi:MAG: class I SAM-dependent methyltransferase [Solirubrobacterales bacterium]|nr:class I SAM-dependent methyltransferase [Solirubrobacterales bacterium]
MTSASGYDRLWEDVYGDLQEVGPAHRHLARLLARMLGELEYASVLEVGVGFGHNLPVLTARRRISRLAGVDASELAVRHVAARWVGEFELLNIATERLDQAFDLVCCALVLEHVPDDRAALANMRAMCSKYLLIATIGGRFERYRPWEEQVGHVRNYAPGELQAKLTDAGFELLQTVCWGFPFYSPLARTLQNRIAASHELSAGARLLARLLYAIYFLNSSRRGDLLLVLAAPR